MQGIYCPGEVHWAHLEASALGSLIAACPAWKRREEAINDSTTVLTLHNYCINFHDLITPPSDEMKSLYKGRLQNCQF